VEGKIKFRGQRAEGRDQRSKFKIQSSRLKEKK
jgi:hypothetical protein